MNTKNTIGLGTAAIGRPLYINIRQENGVQPFSMAKFQQKGIKMLENAYQTGIRHFDTAPGYGMAEKLLLSWVKEKNDPEITISTKWGYTYVADFDPLATVHEIKEHSLAKLNQQWEISQAFLPYLKSYQIHSATFESAVLENEQVLTRLHQLKKQHQLAIGLTTTGANQITVLEKALSIEVEQERLFQSVQFTFNVLDQSMRSMQKLLKKLSGPIIIKEALANGRLIPNRNFSHYQPLYTYMNQLADTYKVGVDAIALRFCMDIFKNATVLSGANHPEHLRSNYDVNTFYLKDHELATLQSFAITPEHYWKERKQLAWN